jgi:formamidopyrimidine-DNA glycosylase
MPELPEVETTKNGLIKTTLNKKVSAVWTNVKSLATLSRDTYKNPKYFKNLERIVVGAKFKSIKRRAKNIIIELDNEYALVIHLKMTGHLMYGKYKFVSDKLQAWPWVPIALESSPLHDPFNRFIRFVFTFSDNTQLVFCDTRKFGSIKYILKSDLHKIDSKHGPEPLHNDFTEKILIERLKNKSGPIKKVLMDQAVISGIGNIYSDEILFASKILPTRTVKSLAPADYKNIFKHTQSILNRGIDFGGDSKSDYRNIDGERGKFQNEHKVYLRKGEPCTICGNKIKKLTIAGRSAHFCDNCQK